MSTASQIIATAQPLVGKNIDDYLILTSFAIADGTYSFDFNIPFGSYEIADETQALKIAERLEANAELYEHIGPYGAEESYRCSRMIENWKAVEL